MAGRKKKPLPELKVTLIYEPDPEALRRAAEIYGAAVVEILRKKGAVHGSGPAKAAGGNG